MAVQDVLLRLGVNDANVRAALGRVAGDVGQLKRTIEGTFAGLGIGLAVRELTAFVQRGAEAGDRLGELAQSAGFTVDAFERLSYAAKFSGADAEHMAHMLGFMSKSMGEAAMGAGHGAAAFDLLGVQVADAHGRLRDTEEVFLELADRFAGMKDGAAKTALALGIFGKKGADIIPVLNKGAESLRATAAEGARLGQLMGGEALKGADRYADALQKLDGWALTLGGSVAAELAPSLERMIESFGEGSDRAGAMKMAAGELAAALRGLAAAGLSVYAVVKAASLALAEGAALSATLNEDTPLWKRLLFPLPTFIKDGLAKRDAMKAILDESDKDFEQFGEDVRKMWGAIWDPAPSAAPGSKPPPPTPDPSFAGGKHGERHGLSDEAKAAAKALAESMKAFNAEVDDYERLVASVATPTDVYLAQLAEINRFADLLSDDEMSRAVTAAGDAFFEASGGAKALADEMGRFDALVADYEGAVDEAATPLDRYNAQMERLQRLLATTPLTGEQAAALAKKYADELDRATGKIDRMAEAWRNFGDGFESVLEQQMVDGFKDGLRGMLEAFGDMIRRMLAQAAAARISQALLGGLVTLGKGALSGLGGGAEAGPTQLGGPDFVFQGYGGERAAGGTVRAGMSYLVGEEGPELLQMPAGLSGQIIPNHELAQASRGQGAGRVEHVLRLDERSKRMTVRELFEELMLEEAASR